VRDAVTSSICWRRLNDRRTVLSAQDFYSSDTTYIVKDGNNFDPLQFCVKLITCKNNMAYFDADMDAEQMPVIDR